MQTKHEDPLTAQNWEQIEAQFFDTEPYNYAIIDTFLTPEVCRQVRASILGNKGWSLMNWQADELFIRNFEMPLLEAISASITAHLPRIFENLELVQHIAFMHYRNKGLCAHSDTGRVTVDLWLTPDEYNREPETGGLICYDVKREPGQQIHEFNARPWCVDYLNAHTKGGKAKLGYKFNRAVIFDARTFHASDRIDFVSEGAHTFRINYALLYDSSKSFRDRYEHYAVADTPPV